MAYYSFKRNEVFNNTLKTHPSVKFVVYSGSAYYNNAPNISGSFTDPIRLTDAGNVSLYELNIDRASTSTGRKIGEVDDNGLIFPFVVKNGTRIDFRTATEAAFNSADYGDVIVSSIITPTSILTLRTHPRLSREILIQQKLGSLIFQQFSTVPKSRRDR